MYACRANVLVDGNGRRDAHRDARVFCRAFETRRVALVEAIFCASARTDFAYY